MRKASYEFESGYAKPVYRGVVFWNGSEDEIGPDNPERMFDDHCNSERLGRVQPRSPFQTDL